MTALLKSALAALTLGAAGVTAIYPVHAVSIPVDEPTAKEPGVLRTSAGNYRFTPTTCAIYKEDGVDDIEIGGTGLAPNGEPLYFEFSSMANEMAVRLGVDGPFKSSDRTLRAGRYVSQEFTVTVTDRTISVPSVVLVDNNGNAVDNNASLTIDCTL